MLRDQWSTHQVRFLTLEWTIRHARGALLPPIARPRRGELYRQLRAAVLDGALAPGMQLPSTRAAAVDYGVSRGLLEEVYARLTDEGFLERGVGRGTFVASTVTQLPRARRSHAASRLSRQGKALAAMAACREPAELRPFNAGVADPKLFPWPTWQRLYARASRELGKTALGFADPRGLDSLRTAIARYLAQVRGVRCTRDEVIVFASAQQAIHALALLLLDRGDTAWIEDPCYLGARAALELAGAKLAPIPVDDDGLRVEVGVRRAPRAKLAYVTPSHQYPTGVATSLQRRAELLAWARRSNAWLLEDDYDGELRHDGRPLTALHALDDGARVIFIGTLNKAMFISLRLAYAVVPAELVEPLANIRTQLDGFTPPVAQHATAMFLDDGELAGHLRRMRAIYAAKRARLVDGIAALPQAGWTWADNPTGMHLMIRHRDGEHVRSIARDSELDLALLSAYRVARGRDDGLFLRYGALDLPAIDRGVATLLSRT